MLTLSTRIFLNSSNIVKHFNPVSFVTISAWLNNPYFFIAGVGLVLKLLPLINFRVGVVDVECEWK